MAKFKIKEDLPLKTRQEIDRIQAIPSGQRTSVEADFLTALAPYLTNIVLGRDEDGNITAARGETSPSDGDTGFAKGAIFINTATQPGIEGIMLYNEGDETSALFNAVTPVFASAEFTTAGGAAAEVIDLGEAGVSPDNIRIMACLKTAGVTPRVLLSAAITDENEITLTFDGDPSDDHVVTAFFARAI